MGHRQQSTSVFAIECGSDTRALGGEEHRQEGNEIGEVASRLLAHAARTARPTSEITEAELLQKINEGWSSEDWDRYHALTTKRRAENLSLDEYSELVALTNEREIVHARRMKLLVELANLRQTSLDAVMDALGTGFYPDRRADGDRSSHHNTIATES